MPLSSGAKSLGIIGGETFFYAHFLSSHNTNQQPLLRSTLSLRFRYCAASSMTVGKYSKLTYILHGFIQLTCWVKVRQKFFALTPASTDETYTSLADIRTTRLA